MQKRIWVWGMRCVLGAVAAAAILVPQPAQAQITRVGSSSDSNQAIGINLGYFALRGLDSRADGDVLYNDLFAGENSLAFEIDDFNGFTFGGEYLIGFGDYIEAGFGVNYYQHTVPSVYLDKVNTNGREIAQDLKLRIVPMTATVRFLPIGRKGFAPYIGGGVGLFNWKYTEIGEFVDADDNIFQGEFGADGNAFGGVVLGGIRVPVSEAITIGGEFRYQKAEGDTSAGQPGLLGDKIDLGGWTTNFTMHFRF